jgi:hypothetical protein
MRIHADDISFLQNNAFGVGLLLFKDQEAVKCLSSLHDKYVVVPADIILLRMPNQGIRHK